MTIHQIFNNQYTNMNNIFIIININFEDSYQNFFGISSIKNNFNKYIIIKLPKYQNYSKYKILIIL